MELRSELEIGGRTLQEWEGSEEGTKTRSMSEGVPEGEKRVG